MKTKKVLDKEVAEFLEVTPQLVSMMLSGEREISKRTANILHDKLGESRDDIADKSFYVFYRKIIRELRNGGKP